MSKLRVEVLPRTKGKVNVKQQRTLRKAHTRRLGLILVEMHELGGMGENLGEGVEVRVPL